MAKQVMDMSTSKGFSEGVSKEQQRNWTEKTWKFVSQKGNYDRSREHLNFEIVKGNKIQNVNKNKSINQKIKENLELRGIKDPNEGLKEPQYRTVVNFIFGGSREQMRKLAFGEQKLNEEPGADNSIIERKSDIENWAKDVYNFVSEKFGEDNIVGFYVHLDETNPHIHCTLLPILDNKFSYKKIFAGKDKYELTAKNLKLHSELAEVNAKYGLDRGSSVIETNAKHKTIEQYRRELNETTNKLSEHIEKQKSISQELEKENVIASKRVKGLTTMINNLTSEKKQIEEEISSLLKEGNVSSERIEKLQDELKEINDKISDKQLKLVRAQETLTEMLQKNNHVKEAFTQNMKELNTLQESKEKTAQGFIAAGALDELAKYVNETYTKMPEQEQNEYQDSFIKDFAEHPAELIGCATALFLNYLDTATSIAQTTGGGGGPGSGWGKKDDEDDMAWIHRCLREASKMLGKGKRRGLSR